MPSARILSIGDELLLGRLVDTNAAWLARWCSDHGLAVAGLTTVGDGEADIRAALGAAAEADLLLCTGGLGPTDDDRTRQALAGHLGVALEEHPAAWRDLVRMWARLRPGQVPAASNRRQILAPRGTALLRNDRGTAPGLLWIPRAGGGPVIACLPGVPHEMMAMAERLAARLPRLLSGLTSPPIAELWLAGVGESAVQDRCGALLDGVGVGITAQDAGHITIRLVGSAAGKRLPRLRRLLQPWLLPAPGLAPSLVHELSRRSLSIACAESCTVGLAAAALGAVPGASACLRGGVVAYDTAVKTGALGLAPELIREQGVVSEAVALAMAAAAATRLGADLGVATTGLAGPGGGSRRQPVGTICVAAVLGQRHQVRTLLIPGDRGRVQRRAAAAALQAAWELLSQSATPKGRRPRSSPPAR
jgi:nicotinamide-nucleotide amidase